jgi:DNA polymerase III subunit delta'
MMFGIFIFASVSRYLMRCDSPKFQATRKIKHKLIRTVLEHRVSHAQLFFGPAGNEKLALAIAYAQLINCTGKVLPPSSSRVEETDSCGVCPSCIKFQKLIHPDLHFIYPVSTTRKVPKKPRSRDFIEEWRTFLLQNNYQVDLHGWYESIGIENKQGIINVDDCHEIISTLSYKSYESEYKVMILWMVEKLFYAAAPKLLKILEEPPDKTLFLLISEDPDQIISTIRSRTLMVKIPENPTGLIASAENSNFSTFRSWMRLCFSKDVIALVSWSNEISKIGRENQKGLLLYALSVIESCATITYGIEQEIQAKNEELKFITDFSRFVNPETVLSFTELFNDAIFHIERNVHAPTLFLDVSLQTIRLFHSPSKKISG